VTRALSTILWSLALLQHVGLKVVWAAVQFSHQHLLNFKPFEIASTIGVLAKLGLQCKVAMDMVAPLFQRSVGPVMAMGFQLSFWSHGALSQLGIMTRGSSAGLLDACCAG